jgi:hypothetical protein
MLARSDDGAELAAGREGVAGLMRVAMSLGLKPVQYLEMLKAEYEEYKKTLCRCGR